jgi:hypothetical protein
MAGSQNNQLQQQANIQLNVEKIFVVTKLYENDYALQIIASNLQ